MNTLQFLILIFGIDSLMLSHLFFNEISKNFKERKAKKNHFKIDKNNYDDIELR